MFEGVTPGDCSALRQQGRHYCPAIGIVNQCAQKWNTCEFMPVIAGWRVVQHNPLQCETRRPCVGKGEEETGVCECYAEKFVSCEWDDTPSCGQIPGNQPRQEQPLHPPPPPLASHPSAPPPPPLLQPADALGLFMDGLTSGFRKGMGLSVPGVFPQLPGGAVPSFLAREAVPQLSPVSSISLLAPLAIAIVFGVAALLVLAKLLIRPASQRRPELL
mmetsp:Transcript_42441/g.99408  ORF Transcript_42441/g.99408 Transcript_42441/m.99408 type:complete len:217 (-) Transcript_42441:319-969(-)